MHSSDIADIQLQCFHSGSGWLRFSFQAFRMWEREERGSHDNFISDINKRILNYNFIIFHRFDSNSGWVLTAWFSLVAQLHIRRACTHSSLLFVCLVQFGESFVRTELFSATERGTETKQKNFRIFSTNNKQAEGLFPHLVAKEWNIPRAKSSRRSSTFDFYAVQLCVVEKSFETLHFGPVYSKHTTAYSTLLFRCRSVRQDRAKARWKGGK